MKKNVLVIGGSGFVGRALSVGLPDFRVVATGNRRKLPGQVPFDALRQNLSDAVGGLGQFTYALLLLGESGIDACGADPAAARALNVEAVLRIIEECDRAGTIPVFTSTDMIHDGRGGPLREEDQPRPTIHYGAFKVEIEQALAARGRPYLVLRLSKVIGDRPDDGSMLASWAAALCRGETIRCASDTRFCPVFVGDVVTAAAQLMRMGASGLFNCGGPQAGSHLDWAQCLAEELARTTAVPGRIVPCRMDDLGLGVRRPLDITLDSSRIQSVIGRPFRHPAAVARTLAERLGAKAVR